MKLRTANKILKAVGTERECVYSVSQIDRAFNRAERTRSSRRNNAFWNALMETLGPIGRAKFLAKTGSPGKAFELLMRTPEEEWKGKPRLRRVGVG